MHLSEISLKQFRSYTDARFVFDPTLTLITGMNGKGKTNLLEAVYVLCQGSSFRVGDRDLIQSDKTWWRVDGVIDTDERQLRYQLDHSPAKQLMVHDTKKRFMYTDRLPVVLFEPTDLQLVHGSPSRRRDALDLMLSTLSRPYKTSLSRYERVLKQRNNILKKQPENSEDILFAWDVLLSEYGVVIVRERFAFIESLNALLGGFYSEISGDICELTVRYVSDLPESITPTHYVSGLHAKLSLDIHRASTSFGPHRDDFEFILNGVDAKKSASRGEVRTIILALKLAYTQLLEHHYEVPPLVLLDDVLSELDVQRQGRLISLLKHRQTIITDTRRVVDATHIEL